MFAKSPSWPFPLFGPGTAESPHPPRARHASIFFCILSSVHPSARAHLQTRTPRCVSFLVLCQAAGLTIMFISAWYRCRKTCNWHSDKTDRQTDRQTDGWTIGRPPCSSSKCRFTRCAHVMRPRSRALCILLLAASSCADWTLREKKKNPARLCFVGDCA